MVFQFIMREVVDFEIGNSKPGWFWMTDSDYYMDLGDVKLFEGSPELLEKYPSIIGLKPAVLMS